MHSIKGLFAIKGYLPSVLGKIDELWGEAERQDLEEVAVEAKETMAIACIIFEGIKVAAVEWRPNEEQIFTINAIAEKIGPGQRSH